MSVAYLNPRFDLDEDARSVTATFRIVNQSNRTWNREEGYSLGWQIFDPETSTFISEGDWLPLSKDLAPAETEEVEVRLTLPPERGHYHVYISPLHAGEGWFYQRGDKFLLVDAFVEGGKAHLLETVATTLGSLRRRNLRRAIGKAFTVPWISIWTNRALIRSMVRRDIMARYRPSIRRRGWPATFARLLPSGRHSRRSSVRSWPRLKTSGWTKVSSRRHYGLCLRACEGWMNASTTTRRR